TTSATNPSHTPAAADRAHHNTTAAPTVSQHTTSTPAGTNHSPLLLQTLLSTPHRCRLLPPLAPQHSATEDRDDATGAGQPRRGTTPPATTLLHRELGPHRASLIPSIEQGSFLYVVSPSSGASSLQRAALSPQHPFPRQLHPILPFTSVLFIACLLFVLCTKQRCVDYVWIAPHLHPRPQAVSPHLYFPA
uniref:Uncharacterized protein n=1 Tax=Triticum urartu TaxID=4572 RepID=A0A8R7Q2A5_TRIUA